MTSESGRLNGLLDEARELVQRGERREALRRLHEALDIDPTNGDVKDRISTIEREIAAMERFNRSRSKRTHRAQGKVSAGEFVKDCMERSEEAFEAGDEVRALQELERARRHDPENREVRRRIQTVRRSIKVNSLADLVRSRIRSDDPEVAVENVRRIFRMWPSAPVLGELLDMLESYRRPAPEEEVAAASLPEETETGVEEPPPEPVMAPEETEAPEDAGVPEEREEDVQLPASGRGRPAAATATLPSQRARQRAPVRRPVPETAKEEERKRSPLIAIIAVVAVLAVAAFAVVRFVLPMLGGDGEQPDDRDAAPARPFTQNLVIGDVPNATLMVEGREISQARPGVYVLSDTVFGPRNVRLTAPGYEVLETTLQLGEGQVGTDTLTLDSIGTSEVRVTLGFRMPEGEEEPPPGAVDFLVDGEPIEGNIDTVRTGQHVFQAQLEGYRSLPESVFVAEPADLRLDLQILAAEQAQVVLQLAGDTPGNATFYVDGTNAGTGRRLSEVLPFGTHSLRVSMEDREDWVATIVLDEEGYSRTISLEEEVETGTLIVGPEPWSDVYVDGELVGTTPFTGVELEPGPHTVRLTNPAFEEDVRTVQITAGETTSIQFSAVPVEEPADTVAEAPEELPVTSPFAISQTPPAVPSQARARGDLHGFVTLAVRVGTDGSVLDVEIVDDPLGLGCGQAAADAVRNWTFSPATQGGEPVEVTTNVQVRFDIE